jgi:hypothetical protein
MTPAQEEAFNHCEEIMREHFSAAVLIVEGEIPGSDTSAEIRCTFHGGFAASVGLLEIGKLNVWREKKDEFT